MENEAKRLTEVSEILKFFSAEELEKIPNDVFKYIHANKDQNYEFKFDGAKKIYNQNIHSDTVAILLYICKEYIFNGEQNDFLNRLEQIDIAQNFKKNNPAEYNKQMFGKKDN